MSNGRQKKEVTIWIGGEEFKTYGVKETQNALRVLGIQFGHTKMAGKDGVIEAFHRTRDNKRKPISIRFSIPNYHPIESEYDKKVRMANEIIAEAKKKLDELGIDSKAAPGCLF